MAWYTVATAGSLEGLQAAVPDKYRYIPEGKRTKIIMNTSPFPVAPIFDLAGAEFAAQLLQKGGKLIDVQGNGFFEIEFEIEAQATGEFAQSSGDMESAEMAWVQIPVAAWIAVIIGLCLLAPLITKTVKLMANFVPSTDGDGSGGGLFDIFKSLFGDYTPYVLIGGAVILYLVLSSKTERSAPVIYEISGSRKRSARGTS